jgi:hypothetical protein
MFAPEEAEWRHKMLNPMMVIFLVYIVISGIIFSEEGCEQYYDLRGSMHNSCD